MEDHVDCSLPNLAKEDFDRLAAFYMLKRGLPRADSLKLKAEENRTRFTAPNSDSAEDHSKPKDMVSRGSEGSEGKGEVRQATRCVAPHCGLCAPRQPNMVYKYSIEDIMALRDSQPSVAVEWKRLKIKPRDYSRSEESANLDSSAEIKGPKEEKIKEKGTQSREDREGEKGEKDRESQKGRWPKPSDRPRSYNRKGKEGDKEWKGSNDHKDRSWNQIRDSDRDRYQEHRSFGEPERERNRERPHRKEERGQKDEQSRSNIDVPSRSPPTQQQAKIGRKRPQRKEERSQKDERSRTSIEVLSPTQQQTKIQDLLQEYLVAQDLSKAERCVQELGLPNCRPVVLAVLNHVVENPTNEQRTLVVNLAEALHTRGALSKDDFTMGLETFVIELSDLSHDYPLACHLGARVAAHWHNQGCCGLEFLHQSLQTLNRYLAEKFAREFMDQMSQLKGSKYNSWKIKPSGIYRMRSSSTSTKMTNYWRLD